MLLTCRNIRQLHDAFVDGELSPSLTAEVHAHLLQCPECQQQYELLSAVGDVIEKDQSEPSLPEGFTSRVVAVLPRPGTETPRRRRWTAFAPGVIPAAAAVLFLCVAFWPTQKEPSRPTLVAGTAVLKEMVNPALDAVADTRKAAQDLNHLFEMTMGQAREDVEQGLLKSEAMRDRSTRSLSISDVLLTPFEDLVRPEPHTDKLTSNQDTVRF